VPGHEPLLGADLAKAAEWVNAQPDWPPLEVWAMAVSRPLDKVA
jgi:hypothetical protein